MTDTKHTVLARKWRPKKFADLVGQKNTVTILQNIISSQRLHHAYLLTGTRGVGKTTIARIIAKAFNCLNFKDNEPCCKCTSCIEIDNGHFVDVIEIDAASNTGVDNIREVIENSQYAPTQGNYKIYIIDEVHMLSKSAFNAMLKTLEEPQPHVVFILATTDPHKLPITILSRCLQLKLRNLLAEEISEYLAHVLHNEKINFEDKSLAIIATSASGSMRDALSLLDQAIAFTNSNITYASTNQMLGNTEEEIIFSILEKLIILDGNEIITIARQIYNEGLDLENTLQSLSKLLCAISITQLTGYATDAKITAYADKISINNVQLYFEICNLGLEHIKLVNDKYSTFIMTLLRMLAFNIATDQNKQVLLATTDSKAINIQKLGITVEPIVTSKTNVIQDKPKEISQQPAIINDHNIKYKADKTQIDFDGNWIGLVQKLQLKLKHSAPFLENSELIEYKNNTFQVKIDSRYKSSFSNHAQEEITNKLNDFFNSHTKFLYTFSNSITNTLKEQNIQNKKQEQADAISAIKNDEKLSTIITTFSATIMPGSIKPLVS